MMYTWLRVKVVAEKSWECFSMLILSQALEETDNKVALIWKHQLMQFNNVSENMASAIVAVYPSPAHLLRVGRVICPP